MNGDRDGNRHGGSRDVYRDERRDRDRDRERDRRRRSRSPGHRGGSRREYGENYSSNRGENRGENRENREYRERDDERFSRRGGDRREGREDRAFDGERRERRDERRREDRDRRGGGHGGGHGGRGHGGHGNHGNHGDHGREREQRRSASPANRRKEPTPDLTNIVSVLERKRRLTQWDIKPPGYENVTAEQAKLSGMFPLPGAPRTQAMDPSKLQAFMAQPGAIAEETALKPSQARQSKRLFIYNLPSQSTPEQMMEFFNLQLNGLNVVSGNDACQSAMIADDRSYAMLEFRQSEDATVALALDGIQMVESNGASNGSAAGLKIQRPADYIAPILEEEAQGILGVSSKVPDSPNKLCISNIPTFITDEQLLELLRTMGSLKSFILAKDTSTEQTRGFAFAEYSSPEIADVAIEGLGAVQLGDNFLKVRRSCVGISQASGLEAGVSAMSVLAGSTSSDLQETRVLQLLNMVTAEDLMDNEEYEEIVEDIAEECSKFGKVMEVKIPRPAGARHNPGVGRVFVKFESKEAAVKALKSLAGRKFADRTVVATFFSEEYFDVSAW